MRGFWLMFLVASCSHAGEVPSDPAKVAAPSSSGTTPPKPAPSQAAPSSSAPAAATSWNAKALQIPGPPNRFDCRAPVTRKHVEGRFVHKYVFQAQGHPLEKESEIVIHYTLAALDAPGERRRFQVTLNDHNGAQIAFFEDLWRTAFQSAWVGIDIPFVVARQGKNWCIEGRKRCPGKDASERELARSLGELSDSVLPASWVADALNGRTSDGSLELELPDDLAHRVGFPIKRHLKLKQVGKIMPAEFALTGLERARMPDIYISYGGWLDRFVGEGPHRVKLTVDADCSIRAIEVSVERAIRPADGIKTYSIAMSSRWTFSDDPS